MPSFTYEEKVYKDFSIYLFYDVHAFILFNIGGEENLWSSKTLVEIYNERKDNFDKIEKAYQVCKEFLDFLNCLLFEKDGKINKYIDEMIEFVYEIRKDKIKMKNKKID